MSGLKDYAVALAATNRAEVVGFADVAPIMAAFVSEATRGVREATTLPPRIRERLYDYFFAQLDLTKELYEQLSGDAGEVAAEELWRAITPASIAPAAAAGGETLAELAIEPLFLPDTPPALDGVPPAGPTPVVRVRR